MARHQSCAMGVAARRFVVLLAPLLALAGCGERPRRESVPSAPDAAIAPDDMRTPTPERDGGGVVEPADAGTVPALEEGALMSVQGVPPPQPGHPTPFFFVGCPAGSRVRVRLISAAVDGASELGEWIGTITRNGVSDHIVAAVGAGGAPIDIQLDETGSIADAPFEYRTTVTTDPKLFDVTGFTFVTRMLNPSEPGFDDVGLGAPFHLVRCP